ncbi:MAG: hypothetical protein ABL886_12175 [Rhodoglobus sp.]
MPEEVIVARVANALIQDVQMKGAGVAQVADALVPGVDVITPVLDGFRAAYGGLWVGGKATLTNLALHFSPNAVNRAVQTGTLDVTVPLADVVAVGFKPAVLSSIVILETPGYTFKVRCFGAKEFAEAVEAARAALR